MSHLEAQRAAAQEGVGQLAHRGGQQVHVLCLGADRIDRQAADLGDGDGVVARIDPEEVDVHRDSRQLLDDAVALAGVEDLLPETPHGLAPAAGDRQMAHAGLTGDELGAEHVERLVRGQRVDE
ncbi:hypothetical protein D9M68_873620 [compost metagenome]